MDRRRATAALADRIVGLVKAAIADLELAAIRDLCDIHTGGEFPPGELDKLAAMVKRRLGPR
ncbi:MAG: hypothetical protein HQL38_03105 [Alphaproteobacteria bacterium]|nr:hypothetical protein [Alphaproteobacteria bacterium]